MRQEYCIMARNTRKMQLIGMLPKGYDNTNEGINWGKLEKRTPFSKHYKSYEDYKADFDKVANMDLYNQDMPDDLFIKLKETAEELGLV